MSKHVGHHRAPRYFPHRELSQIAAEVAHPAVKASAVAMLAGGLVAGMVTTAGAAEAPSVTVESRSVAAPFTPYPDTLGAVGFTTKVVPRPAAAAPARTTPAATPTRTTASRSTTARPAPAPAAPKPGPTQAPPSIPNDGSIIGIARSLTGIRYSYGGTSPATGFDCSGFTSYVYRLAGKSIPRTASAQQAAATPVSSPQLGDLVFVGRPATHAGIYAGPGMMYDAQRPGTTTGLHPIWTSNVTYGRF